MQHSSLLESPLTQTTIRSDYIMRISLALAFILCVSFLPVVSAEELQSLFNGKNLDGWAGQAGFWSVQDGSIVGETTKDKPAKPNTFLVWQGGDVSDFELTCKVRFRGNNSGVQYRSELTDAEKFALKGYQADLHPKPEFFGMMYGEKTGRGIIAQRFQRAVAGPKGKAKVTATTVFNIFSILVINRTRNLEYFLICREPFQWKWGIVVNCLKGRNSRTGHHWNP